MKTCPSCGYENPVGDDDARFCPRCGVGYRTEGNTAIVDDDAEDQLVNKLAPKLRAKIRQLDEAERKAEEAERERQELGEPKPRSRFLSDFDD